MVYIFFVYGLAFFSFGLVLLMYPKEIDGIKFIKHIWLIGIFGIVHGVSEWIDMFKEIAYSDLYMLNMAGLVSLPFSYSFLVYFGLKGISEHYKVFSSRYIFPIAAVWVIVYLLVIFRYDDIFLYANIWTRYLIGIPAIVLSVYVLWLERANLYTNMAEKVRNYLIAFSVILSLYGISSGLIVPKGSVLLSEYLNQTMFENYFGFPIQLLRALLALVSTYIVIVILKALRQEAQEQLIKFSKAIEVIGDSVVITDSNGVIQYVNSAYETETGYTLSETIGKKPSILKSGMHDFSFYEKMWKTILSGEIYRGYLINKNRKGEFYNEYKAIAPIIDSHGTITHFVSTGKNVTEHMLLEKKFEQLASIDKLTGLSNRMKFDEVMHYSIDRAKRYKVNLSLILFDIDNFKKVNDVYGHMLGDYVLKAIAQIGQKNIRKSDLLARWGGEEFMIIQPDIPQDEAIILAERLCKEIENYHFEAIGRLSASFGVTSFKENDTADSFVTRVDKALYSAKINGKNRVVEI